MLSIICEELRFAKQLVCFAKDYLRGAPICKTARLFYRGCKKHANFCVEFMTGILCQKRIRFN